MITPRLRWGLDSDRQFQVPISGIRFYKPGTETFTATVTLWDYDTHVALGTSTSEIDDSPGWKQVNFSPVTISADKWYVASYHTNSLSYYYAWNVPPQSVYPITNGPLTALYGQYVRPLTGYPGTDLNANFWVDVAFNGGGSGVVNFNLTSVTSAAGCILTGNPISSTSITVNAARVWTGSSGADWSATTNWSGGVVPLGENAVVPVVKDELPGDQRFCHYQCLNNQTGSQPDNKSRWSTYS